MNRAATLSRPWRCLCACPMANSTLRPAPRPEPRLALRRGLWLASALTLAACEMAAADVLEGPRLLGVRATPAAFVPGEAVTVEALAWDLAGEDLVWSACPVAWAATDPITCPAGDALPLGEGNPLTFTPPVASPRTGWWLLVEGPGAIPAGRRLDPEPDGEATILNPPAFALTRGEDPAGAPGALTLTPSFEDPDPPTAPPLDPSRVVISWYVTAGTLEPARTVGLAPATFTPPDGGAEAPVTIVAVARDVDGGTTWSSTTLEAAP